MIEVRFVRLDPAARPPERAHPSDAGFDLVSVEELTIPPHGRAVVGTGIAIQLPEGWCAVTTPRSGRAAREGLSIANTPGVIDAGYRGEIKVICLNTDPDQDIRIQAGDRIAQLLVLPVPAVEFTENTELDQSSRGVGGFGSTGK